LPLIFLFPYSPYISPNFFPNFDHNSHFLLHGTAKRLNYTHYTQGCLTCGPKPYMARGHPSKRWSLTSTVTPTPPLYSFFSFSPKSKTDYTARHTTDTKNNPSYMERTNHVETLKNERNNGRNRQSESGCSGCAGNSLTMTWKN